MITAEAPDRLAKLTCPLCGARQAVMVNGFSLIDGKSVVDPDRGYAFCNCRNIFFTDWVYMRPAVYDAGYYEKYATDATTRYFDNYYESYARLLGELSPTGTVCELGCVNLTLLGRFKAAGYRTVGVDIFDHPHDGHDLLVGNIEDLPLPSSNILWASHILEHVRDPLRMVQRLYGALQPGGALFVAMPDPYAVDWAVPYIWAHWNLDEHHILWDLRSFCDVLREAGFEVLQANRNYEAQYICTSDYHIVARKPEGDTHGGA